MKLLFWLLLFSLAGINAYSGRPFAQVIASVGAIPEPLPAPVLLSPEAGADLHTYPRVLEFQWTAVVGASSYAIEIDCFDCCARGAWCSEVQHQGYLVRGIETPGFVFTYWGDQPGRWRVWAAGKSGEGAKSEWRAFTFANLSHTQIVPPLPPYDTQLPPMDCSWRSSMNREPWAGPPYLTYAPEPQYGDIGRENRINAVVVLDAKVTADGWVEALCLQGAPRADLAESAIQAVKSWWFAPRRQNGLSVPSVAHLEIRFRACCDRAVVLYPAPKRQALEISRAEDLEPRFDPCASWRGSPPAPGTVAPRAIYAPEPQYPEAARRTTKISGEVSLVVKIDIAGQVEDVCVSKSLRPDLDESAVHALMTWRFEPARKGGIAVPYTSIVEVTFNLN
jgi:TonB family protein